MIWIKPPAGFLRQIRKMKWLFWLIPILLSSSVAAQDVSGDPALGRALALRSCAGCHAVAQGQAKPATDAAPAFITLARDPAVTAERLRAFLGTPHARMPAVILSKQELEHVVVYILGMRLNN